MVTTRPEESMTMPLPSRSRPSERADRASLGTLACSPTMAAKGLSLGGSPAAVAAGARAVRSSRETATSRTDRKAMRMLPPARSAPRPHHYDWQGEGCEDDAPDQPAEERAAAQARNPGCRQPAG